ncbi:MAG: hypothetical protein U1F83_15905 [Verrucomicrobiota bacterium]
MDTVTESRMATRHGAERRSPGSLLQHARRQQLSEVNRVKYPCPA